MISTGIFGSGSNFGDRFVRSHDDLEALVSNMRGLGLKIVLTQGVFDLVHIGHLEYMEKARSYGNVLIVAVDSDALTKRRKGPDRPVVPEDERLRILTHSRHVDVITLLDSSIQDGLIQKVRPDVLVVSETTKDFPDEVLAVIREFCGEIIKLPPQATTSTSARVRLLTIDGAKKLATIIQDSITEFLHGGAE